MIHISANYSNSHSSDTGAKKNNNKKCCFSLHIVTHLCQFMAQNSEIWGVKKNRQLFEISKIATLQPSKRPIGQIFKNPQGM